MKNIKQTIKQTLKKHVALLMKRLDIPSTHTLRTEIGNSQVVQRQLYFQYRTLKNSGGQLPVLDETGFRVYSETDEDGILLYIFSIIGFTNRVCVDIAFPSPYRANTTNLICNWNFTGLLIEGSDNSEASEFFKVHPDTFANKPRLLKQWITAENINAVIGENGITGEIDLFSLDVDGVDYWLWKSLEVIRPRVTVVEYHNFWGPDRAVTVPYSPGFNRLDRHPNYQGASLPAFSKLAKEKGYRLIGCNKDAYNAFFVRNDLGAGELPEVTVEECLQRPFAIQCRKNGLPLIKDFSWVDV